MGRSCLLRAIHFFFADNFEAILDTTRLPFPPEIPVKVLYLMTRPRFPLSALQTTRIQTPVVSLVSLRGPVVHLVTGLILPSVPFLKITEILEMTRILKIAYLKVQPLFS